MKILRISNNKGQFSIDGENFKEVDLLLKEDILALMESVVNLDVEMDSYNDDLIQQPAHKIIYRNLYQRLTSLLTQKERFKQESQNMFKDAIEKYRV